MRDTDLLITKLVEYGKVTGLITEEDEIYARNRIMERLKEDEYEEPCPKPEVKTEDLPDILGGLCDLAFENGLISDNTVTMRDLFDTELMNCLMPRPSEVISLFKKKYEGSPKEATDYFYKLSQDSDYIRRYRIKKDLRWKTETEYGDLDITINLSKPEKDPKDIAAAKKMKQSGYPKCLLCRENEGYAGRANHPARGNHRIIPLKLCNSSWGFQYSPYVYYNEHCIVFNYEHVPMKISGDTMRRLFAFVKLFPHYFLGSNADLPIVGGSILTHDHFQGGNYEFAMAKAGYEEKYAVPDGFDKDIEAGIVHWPLSVIRLRAKDTDKICELGEKLLSEWREYSDEKALIYAVKDGEPHNTITPIARFKDGFYELDLVLRNNLTTTEHPLGLYHPHEKLHHIKKENIGLIEVMGLAVLPARLKAEMARLEETVLEVLKTEDAADATEKIYKALTEDEALSKHADWAKEWMESRLSSGEKISAENIDSIVHDEIGKVFKQVLEDAGVYKCSPEGREAFGRFLDKCGFKKL